jgi:hypothetical protein
MSAGVSHQRASQLKARASGLCVQCFVRNDRKTARCLICTRKHSARQSREPNRVLRCKLCDIAGHNSRSCQGRDRELAALETM